MAQIVVDLDNCMAVDKYNQNQLSQIPLPTCFQKSEAGESTMLIIDIIRELLENKK